MINRIDAVLPHLTAKEELADLWGEMRTGFADLRGEMRTALAGKPSHAYLWASWGDGLRPGRHPRGCGLGAGDPPSAAASGSAGRHRLLRPDRRLPTGPEDAGVRRWSRSVTASL
jgi:hypothetical protein